MFLHKFYLTEKLRLRCSEFRFYRTIDFLRFTQNYFGNKFPVNEKVLSSDVIFSSVCSGFLSFNYDFYLPNSQK